MSYVDGNAAAGLLTMAFGVDMTNAEIVCAACGSRHRLAQTHMYLRCPGAVLRCPDCENAELVLVEVDHHVRTTVRGLRSMQIDGLAEPTGAGEQPPTGA